MSKNNMNMSKRSQASLRVKTIQSQMDPNDNNPWMNIQETKSKPKFMRNIAASMVEEGNKQNNSINLPSYQSVKQFSEQSIIQHQTPSTHKTPLMLPSEVTKSAKLRQSLIFDRVNQSKSKESQLCKFNYVQQYYQIQIDKLNSKILDMNKELTKYRQLYSSKQSELEDLNQGLSERISKQNCQKNVLIKEINSNNIQIKRLKEELNLQKSEKETLKIVLKQKQIAIEELNDSIIQTESNRKKIQGYQMQLREHQATLQEIQMQTNMLKLDNEKKDNVIAVCNKRITNLQSRLTLYQQEIKVLENQVLAFKEQSNTNKNRIEVAQKQCQQWKNKYCDVKLELEEIPELQMKLKNSLLMVDDLQARAKQLSMANQKLKMQSGNYQNLKLKMGQFQRENGQLRKQLRQKVQQFETFQNSNKLSCQLQQELDYNRNKVCLMERQIQEKDQQMRLSKVKLEERDNKISSLYEELEAISKQSNRIKQLKSKINTLFSENEKLHECLRQKIRQIEELQRKNNVLESKNTSSNNQTIKLKSINEKLTEELTQSQSKLQNMKNRWQTELGSKLMLEEKCTRLNKDVASLKSQIAGLEEDNSILSDQVQAISGEFEQRKVQFSAQLDEINGYRAECQNQLQYSNKKIEQLRANVKELKNQIDRQIQIETNHLVNINKLENRIYELQQEIKRLEQSSERQRKFWDKIQEVSSMAQKEYK